jgi:uncharacterized protein YuzE
VNGGSHHHDIRFAEAEERNGHMGEERELSLSYDAKADVLYVTFLPGVPAVGLEVEEGVIVRVDPDTNEVVGVTVTGFTKRSEHAPALVHLRGSLRVESETAPA